MSSQNKIPRLPASACHTWPGPPRKVTASTVIMASSPIVNNATNDSGFMPVRYALR